MTQRWLVLLLVVVGLVAGFSGSAAGQEITGQIRGTVSDSTGAVVANATVAITNIDRSQVVRTVQTGSDGEYVAPLLPVGRYSVTVEASGFKRFVQTDIVLNVSDRLLVNASLQAGAGAETVTVEAAPIVVNLQNAAVEGLITGTQVRELPLNNRNYEQLLTLQPGVVSNAADSIYVGTTNPTGGVNIVSYGINGNRQSQNNWTIDAADNVDHGSNITLLVYPSVDAISEFKVERSNYSPEFGRSASGQINVVTRAGTSHLHGSLYEFFRNDAMNAANSYQKHSRTDCNNPAPGSSPCRFVLRYNDFGGTFGGPIYKDKTFFFFSEEVRRVRTPVTFTATVPTTAEIGGNFRMPVCTAIDATGACTATGKQIATIHPIAAAYIKDIFSRLPANTTGTLVSNAPGVFDYREELIRADHVFNSRFVVMGRFINDTIPTVEPYGLFGPQSRIPGAATTKTDSPGRQAMGRFTMQLTHHTYNEVGYAYSYGAITSSTTGLLNRAKSPDVAQAVSLPYRVTLDRVPNLIFADLENLAGFGQYLDFNRNHNFFDNFNWTKGKHSLKFGFSYNRYQKEENAAGDNVGNYNFDATNAVGSDPVSTREQDWANFLIGYASVSFVQSPIDTTANIHQSLYEGYAQDEWRVAPSLTLTYGLRYSYFQTPYDSGKMLTTFEPNVFQASQAPKIDSKTGQIVPNTGSLINGLIIGGKNSPYGRYITKQDKKNFAPRLGLAWDPFKNGKTSIRAGIGIFYDSIAAGLIEDNVFNNPPYISGANFGSLVNISNAGSSAALASAYPASLWTTAPNWHSPYSTQWNLDVQQELKRGFIVDIGYVGNKGTHLPGVQDINQVMPGVAAASGFYSNPYAGGTTTGRRLNAVRPYLGWASIGQIAPVFDSNYNSLQASIEKRFAGNSAISFAYTWSHALTDNQTDRSSGLQNTYCRVCDYGPASLDRRHVITANYIYELPWLRSQRGYVGHAFGGWQVSGIVTANSGLPSTVFVSRTARVGDPAASGLNVDGAPNNGRPATPRPNQVGDPNTGPKTWDQFFNTAAFANLTGPQTYGGSERRGAVIGPGLWRYDMALLKSTRITETVNMQFRAEAFNLFNHTNFSTIGTSSLTSTTYGMVTNTRDPRILQLAVKFSF